MVRFAVFLVVAAIVGVGCGGASSATGAGSTADHDARLYAIEGIERTWHKAASTGDVDLMMTLWASDATFNIGTETLSGSTAIRDFFAHRAGPFKPGHHWVSETPAYKTRVTVNGDHGTLYFQCHYVDAATGKVVSVVAADQDVQRIDGKWLITRSAASTVVLEP
jgi:ketosteroid isomerase-like protein